MKKIILSLMIFSLSFAGFSQQKVALHHGSVVTIFGGGDPFTNAYNTAVNGDVIYLPGGNLPFPTEINKGITIIGAGHYPSATTATNKTILNGSISIFGNADNLVLEGIEITGSLSFVNNNKVDNVVLKRCKISLIGYGGDGTTPCINNTIKECIIDSFIDMSNARSSLITNCIITNGIYNGAENGISNNLFLFSGGNYIFINVDNSDISNNILLQHYSDSSYFHTGCELSNFSNNVFSATPTAGSNIFSNNYVNSNISSLFVSQTGNVFSYTDNYNLVNPTTYSGTDGNQVGLYGGLFPFKDLSVPVNPQILSKSVSNQTNTNGEINIQFQVKAQNN